MCGYLWVYPPRSTLDNFRPTGEPRDPYFVAAPSAISRAQLCDRLSNSLHMGCCSTKPNLDTFLVPQPASACDAFILPFPHAVIEMSTLEGRTLDHDFFQPPGFVTNKGYKFWTSVTLSVDGSPVATIEKDSHGPDFTYIVRQASNGTVVAAMKRTDDGGAVAKPTSFKDKISDGKRRWSMGRLVVSTVFLARPRWEGQAAAITIDGACPFNAISEGNARTCGFDEAHSTARRGAAK